MAPSPIPDGYATVTPYLVGPDARGLIAFMASAFGATQRGDLFQTPDGSVLHGEVEIGGSVVMVSDATDEYAAMPAMIHLYLPDVDATFAAATAAGATVRQAPEDQFYGDRSAVVVDPFGNYWSLASHVEDVSDEEMAERGQAMAGGDDRAS